MLSYKAEAFEHFYKHVASKQTCWGGEAIMGLARRSQRVGEATSGAALAR